VKPLLVGEAPNASGYAGPGRLAEYGLDFVNLIDRFPGRAPTNPLACRFPMQQAIPKATELHAVRPIHQPFVLLGTRVASAFGYARDEYEWLRWFSVHGRRVAVCPHPSGLNRWWNLPSNRYEADRFFKQIVARELNRD
jgi:hypothetical protein